MSDVQTILIIAAPLLVLIGAALLAELLNVGTLGLGRERANDSI